MSDQARLNLDRLAAQRAQAILRRVVDEEETQRSKPKDKKKTEKTEQQPITDVDNAVTKAVDNAVTKALGVLQENGVYACFLYLLAREKENGRVVVDEMLSLLDGLGFGWGKPASEQPEEILKHISDKVTENLERLLLAKETLEQMLIYARYGAKARG